MNLLGEGKWTWASLRDEDGNPGEGAPYLTYEIAGGSTQAEFRAKKARILDQYDIPEEPAGKAHMRMVSTPEGFEMCMEICLAHVTGSHGLMWGEDNPIDWSELDETQAKEGKPSRRELLNKLGRGEAALWNLISLADSIVSGLSPQEKKVLLTLAGSSGGTPSTSDATAPSAPDSPDSKTSDSPAETST